MVYSIFAVFPRNPPGGLLFFRRGLGYDSTCLESKEAMRDQEVVQHNTV